jgi:hypothetical protein
MTNPQKRKGDAAELEVQRMFRDHLGIMSARRMLGAGRTDDVGDIAGVPDLTIQVAAWANVATAVRVKPVECEQQQARAGTNHGCTFLRLRGGLWRVVQTEQQFFGMWREVMQ